MFGRGVRLTALGGLASAAFVHSSNNNSSSGHSGPNTSFSRVQQCTTPSYDNAGTGKKHRFQVVTMEVSYLHIKRGAVNMHQQYIRR
jgi:hypothetical protein